jgi:hypothetical protein
MARLALVPPGCYDLPLAASVTDAFAVLELGNDSQ